MFKYKRFISLFLSIIVFLNAGILSNATEQVALVSAIDNSTIYVSSDGIQGNTQI